MYPAGRLTAKHPVYLRSNGSPEHQGRPDRSSVTPDRLYSAQGFLLHWPNGIEDDQL